jgi:hypothetical protein
LKGRNKAVQLAFIELMDLGFPHILQIEPVASSGAAVAKLEFHEQVTDAAHTAQTQADAQLTLTAHTDTEPVHTVKEGLSASQPMALEDAGEASRRSQRAAAVMARFVMKEGRDDSWAILQSSATSSCAYHQVGRINIVLPCYGSSCCTCGLWRETRSSSVQACAVTVLLRACRVSWHAL